MPEHIFRESVIYKAETANSCAYSNLYRFKMFCVCILYAQLKHCFCKHSMQSYINEIPGQVNWKCFHKPDTKLKTVFSDRTRANKACSKHTMV